MKSVSAEENVCEQCKISAKNLLFGFPQCSRVQIYHWILNNIFSTFDILASNLVADVLLHNEKEIEMAMKDLEKTFPSYFELTNSYSDGPVYITENGIVFLNRPIITTVSIVGGIAYETFTKLYPMELCSLALTEKWVEAHERLDGKVFVYAGSNQNSCQQLHFFLHYVKHGLHITAHAKHKLFKNKFIACGPVTSNVLMRKGKNFPKTLDELNQMWFKLIDHYVMLLNKSRPKKKESR